MRLPLFGIFLAAGVSLAPVPSVALAEEKAAPNAAEAAVSAELVVLHGTNDGSGIDPKIGKMSELSKPPFSSYNSYKLHWAKTGPGNVIKPLHMNQDQTRYELHRVWVVDSVLKPGQRHVYKRRTLYIDEDSWQIVAVDAYDNRDQLWRVQEGHVINYYNVPTLWTTMETTYDLQSRRYLALGFEDDANRSYDFGIKRTLQDYTAAALRARGTR